MYRSAQYSKDEFESIYKANISIVNELGINLFDLPDWMNKEIENILALTLDKDKVYKISRLIENYLREERSAV